MGLIKPQNAIHNNRQCGPCFGGGCDIAISDKCNLNNYSGSAFPDSYNFKSKPYSQNE